MNLVGPSSLMVMIFGQDVPAYVPSGLTIGTCLAAIGLFWRIQRGVIKAQDQEIVSLKKECTALKAENRWCEWRFDILVDYFRRKGEPIPPEVWGTPPQEGGPI